VSPLCDKRVCSCIRQQRHLTEKTIHTRHTRRSQRPGSWPCSPYRLPCKSFVKGEKDSPDARLGGARTIEAIRTRSSHVCLSALVPAFAEPDIHSLSQAASAHQNPA